MTLEPRVQTTTRTPVFAETIRVHTPGGPEVLCPESIKIPPPGPHEVRVRQRAIGVNFLDVYFRRGERGVSTPFTPGHEAAGTVEAVGAEVDDLAVGQRVAYGMTLGAYAEARNVSATALVPLPDDISFEQAAVLMLKGVTAYYLMHEVNPVKPNDNDVVLVHAAAGGVGSLLTSWLKAKGATVIGTVGSSGKAEAFKALGGNHPVLYREENVVERVKMLTGGAGVKVVFDGVGRTTFEASLASLAPEGQLVLYGSTSGAPEPFDLTRLNKDALTVTYPSVSVLARDPERFRRAGAHVFEALRKGILSAQIGQRYALAEASEAHRALETRETLGATVLVP